MKMIRRKKNSLRCGFSDTILEIETNGFSLQKGHASCAGSLRPTPLFDIVNSKRQSAFLLSGVSYWRRRVAVAARDRQANPDAVPGAARSFTEKSSEAREFGRLSVHKKD